MSTLQEQYDSIVAQLDAFLESADLTSAIACITNKTLEEKIKEIDCLWTGLREKGDVTFERLKKVVTSIRQGIFCGGGHLFYIRVMSKDREAGTDGEYLYPITKKDNSFQYVVQDVGMYFVDIKDLSGRHETPNLYTYKSNGSPTTDYPHTFNLTNPVVREAKNRDGLSEIKYLPYGVRMYGFIVNVEYPQDAVTLTSMKDGTETTVLTLKFDHSFHSVTDPRHKVNFLLHALLETCL